MLATTLLLLLAAQRTTAIVPNPDDPPPPKRAQTCREQSGEITVCAPMSAERMAELEARFGDKPARARFTVPGVGTGSVDAVQRGIAGGVSVPSLMATLTIPLGKKDEKKPADEE